MTTIDQAFQTHADRLAGGFAAMSPAPSRQRFNPHPTMSTAAPEPTSESTDELVIRESGLVGAFELGWHSPANIEALTSDILTKKERSEISGIAEATERLGAEVAKADLIPRNPAKVAIAWNAENPGQPVPQDLIETASHGEELRRFARSTAKAACVNFFDSHAVPAIHGIYKKAASRLADVITERVKAEQAAFEKFAELYHDDDVVAYRPSNGVLRLIARRRQLLDNEIQRTSPPSVRASLAGVFTV